MSLVYRKVRVESASNGAFRQNGILLMDELDHLWYATNATNISINVTDSEAQPPLSFSPNAIVKAASVTVPQPCSFATLVRMFSQDTVFPFLHGFVLHLEDDAQWAENGSVLNLDEILGENTREAQAATASISGVCIKPGYSQVITYFGFGGYHGHTERGHFNRPLQADKPWKVGVELEVYARNREAFNTITNARSNWFLCERDGSLHEMIGGVSGLGVEIKTIPLKACDAKSVDFWAEPMDRLKQLAVSKGHSTTGLHVHIGIEALGSNDTERQKTLAKLQLFYIYMIEENPDAHNKNVTICGREQGYSGSISDAKIGTVDTLKRWSKDGDLKNILGGVSDDLKSQIGTELRQKNRNNRWDINIEHLNDYKTVEFRKADGRISKTRLAAVVTWWEQMIAYCRVTDWHELDFNAFFRKVTAENPCIQYFFNSDEEA